MLSSRSGIRNGPSSRPSIERLETQVAVARSRQTDQGRTPFDPWVMGAILLVTLVVAVLAYRRRRMMPAMTDL